MDPAAYAAVRTGTDVVAKQAHVGGSFLAGEVPDRAYAEGWVPPGQIRVDDSILSTEPLNSWKALRLQKDLFGGGSDAESAKKKHLARLRQERAVLRTFLGDLLEHEQKQLGELVLAKLICGGAPGAEELCTVLGFAAPVWGWGGPKANQKFAKKAVTPYASMFQRGRAPVPALVDDTARKRIRQALAATEELRLFAGDLLVRANENLAYAFIVAEGELEVQRPTPNGREIYQVGEGGLVNAPELLTNTVASASTVMCTSPFAKVYVVPAPAFMVLIGDYLERNRRDLLAILERSAEVGRVPVTELREIADGSVQLEFKRGATVTERGTIALVFFMILHGTAEAYLDEDVAPEELLKKGRCFGTETLEGRAGTSTYKHTVKVAKDLKVLAITRSSLEDPAHRTLLSSLKAVLGLRPAPEDLALVAQLSPEKVGQLRTSPSPSVRRLEAEAREGAAAAAAAAGGGQGG